MRKYIIGGLVGAALTFSLTAYGENLSMIGKTVQGENNVIVDTYTLPNKAVAIDGTTYAPVRAIGEAVGYDVTFENQEVHLTKKEVEPVGTPDPGTPDPGTTPTPEQTPQPAGSTYSKDQIESGISGAELGIKLWGKIVEGYDSSGKHDNAETAARKALQDAQDQLQFWQNEKSKLDASGGD